MKRLVLSVLGVILCFIMALAGLAVLSPLTAPWQATAVAHRQAVPKKSPGAYAYVQHISAGWRGKNISVKCHTNGVWYALGDGQHSRQFCGQNGWVDALDVGGCMFLTVRNIATGQTIQYGNGYHGYGPPGGSWDAWVTTRFPNPC